MQGSRTVGEVVGGNLQRVRERAGQTQEQAAHTVQRLGLRWTRATIASLESGRRESVDLGALVVLALAYRVEIGEWFVGDGRVALTRDAHLDLADVREILAGQLGAPRRLRVSGKTMVQVMRAFGEEMSALGLAQRVTEIEARAAARLGVTRDEIVDTAVRLWGNTLTSERDVRVAARGGGELSRRSLQAVRGVVSRQLLAELRHEMGRPNGQYGAAKGEET